MVCFQEGWQAGPVPLGGFAIAFTASFCWALYSVLVKRPSARLGPIRSFGVISFITSLLLLPLTLAFGKIETPLRVDAGVNLILIVSAVTCISLAHVLYYVAIRKVGVALSQTLQLICPAGALGLSALFFGERLTQAQLWSAGLLLFGAYLAMQELKRAAVETAGGARKFDCPQGNRTFSAPDRKRAAPRCTISPGSACRRGRHWFS